MVKKDAAATIEVHRKKRAAYMRKRREEIRLRKMYADLAELGLDMTEEEWLKKVDEVKSPIREFSVQIPNGGPLVVCRTWDEALGVIKAELAAEPWSGPTCEERE